MNAERVNGWISSDAVADPFYIDENGKLALRTEGALDTSPDGGLLLRTEGDLEQTPGSPVTLRVRPNRTTARVADEARATAVAAAASLVTKQDTSERGTTYASLVGGTVPFAQLPTRGGFATLIPADKVEISAGPSFNMGVGTYAITFGRKTPGTSPGHIYADPGEYTAKFAVRSTDALDDGDFCWTVVKIT